MANYVSSTLANGEKIICQAHYHWLWWAKRILVCLLIAGLGIGLDVIAGTGGIVTGITIAVALAILAYASISYTNDEFVITNFRVVLKTGIIARDVFEMQIQKVETVGVEQSVMGRMFNYGTIVCRGTGGTNSAPFEIADPLAFRAAFHSAIKDGSIPPISYSNFVPTTNQGSAQLDDQKLDEIIALLKEISSKLEK